MKRPPGMIALVDYGAGNLRSDVAIVYGIDPGLPKRIATWRERGYRIHVMTGVSWGNYQDYLYGRFDGINHEDEAQTERGGQKIHESRNRWIARRTLRRTIRSGDVRRSRRSRTRSR